MAGTALLVVDMLNPYDHEDADKLVESVEDVVVPTSSSRSCRSTTPRSSSRRATASSTARRSSTCSTSARSTVSSSVARPPDRALADAALRMMERNMRAQVLPATEGLA